MRSEIATGLEDNMGCGDGTEMYNGLQRGTVYKGEIRA